MMLKLNNDVILKAVRVSVPDERDTSLDDKRQSIIANFCEEKGLRGVVAAHQINNRAMNLVVQVYRDQKSYEEHFGMDYYQSHSGAIQSATRYDLQPVYVGMCDHDLRMIAPNTAFINAAEMDVDPRDNGKMAEIIKSGMDQTLKNESGALVMIAGQDKVHANHWLIFEVYSDSSRYREHLQQDYYKSSFSRADEVVQSYNVLALSPDIVMTSVKTKTSVNNN